MSKSFEKITSIALSSSLILESCVNGYYMDFPADDINAAIENNNDNYCYQAALPLKINVLPHDTEYIFFLQALAADIIANPNVAEEFISNPNEYIAKRGFSGEKIAIDSKLTKIILALANEDICDAIQKGDVKKYLSLLKTNNLIDTITINDVNTAIDYQKEINKFIRNNSMESIDSQETTSIIIFAVAIIVGAAAVVWAVVVEHFAAANAVAVATAIAAAAAYVTVTLSDAKGGTEKGEDKKIATITESLLCSNTISIWSIKSQETNHIPLLADTFTEQTIDSFMEYIQQKYPEEYSKCDKDVLRNSILINMQNYSYE